MVTAKEFAENFEKSTGRKIKISGETIEKVRKIGTGKSAADLEKLLIGAPLVNQFVASAALVSIASENCQSPGTFDLANDIVAGQGEKIARYGEKAYPLSERQIKVVANQVAVWLK